MHIKAGCDSDPRSLDEVLQSLGVVCGLGRTPLIYRTPGFNGSATFGTVTANHVPITKIENGGYLPYVAVPGERALRNTTEATSKPP